MKRLMVAAIAVVSLVLLGPGTLRAAGQPNANPQQNAGAAPGQQFGTSADVAAKKRLDEQKYQNPAPGSANAARHGPSSSKKE